MKPEVNKDCLFFKSLPKCVSEILFEHDIAVPELKPMVFNYNEYVDTVRKLDTLKLYIKERLYVEEENNA